MEKPFRGAGLRGIDEAPIAFIDIGGVDALLHVGEIAWGRVNKPADVLSVGQQIEVRVLKLATEVIK